MLSSHRCSRYKDNGRLNNSIRWNENNNVKRVDSVKVSMLSNLCKITFHFQGLTMAAINWFYPIRMKQRVLDASIKTYALFSSLFLAFCLVFFWFLDQTFKTTRIFHPTQYNDAKVTELFSAFCQVSFKRFVENLYFWAKVIIRILCFLILLKWSSLQTRISNLLEI